MTTERPNKIECFREEYRFLSNFWPAEVRFEGIAYPTVEHAYQAAKTLDIKEREWFAALPRPGKAKIAAGKRPIRIDWPEVRVGIMTELVRKKFTRHADLAAKLLATGDAEIIEGNAWGDTFWGVCEGVGENNLGRVLMAIRAEIRAAE